ncbi:MAG: ABC transporter ATP-binding protein [Polyangiaceae bacterium]
MERPRIRRVRSSKVVKTFGATAALRGVDAELSAGRLTLVAGSNGSGKTTLLRILGTILSPTSGSVSYEPLGQDRHAVRHEVGWLSHEALAYGDLSGRENIQLTARFHGLDPKEAWDQVSERFQLGRFALRPLRTNSRGQRQRVALARALAHRPSLVLLDEPTTGLDTAGVTRLLEVVRQEVEARAVVAVVTHEPRLFDELEPVRIVLDRGKVVDVARSEADV